MPATASELSNAAKAHVRARLRDRPIVPVIQGVGEKGLALVPQTEALIQILAKLIGVDVNHLRIEDQLRETLRVHRNELPVSIQGLMTKVGLTDVIDPFSFDLLNFVEERISQDQRRLERPSFLPSPKDEEEWIDRIMDMTVAQFLQSLA